MLVSQRSSSMTRRPLLDAESVPPVPPVPKPVRNEFAPSCKVPSCTLRFAAPDAVPVPAVGAITSDPPPSVKIAPTSVILHSPL